MSTPPPPHPPTHPPLTTTNHCSLYSCRIACERSESARERRTALCKSNRHHCRCHQASHPGVSVIIAVLPELRALVSCCTFNMSTEGSHRCSGSICVDAGTAGATSRISLSDVRVFRQTAPNYPSFPPAYSFSQWGFQVATSRSGGGGGGGGAGGCLRGVEPLPRTISGVGAGGRGGDCHTRNQNDRCFPLSLLVFLRLKSVFLFFFFSFFFLFPC